MTTPPRRRSSFIAALFALALVLGACGSDDDVQATELEDQDLGTEDPPVVEGGPDADQDDDSSITDDSDGTDSDADAPDDTDDTDDAGNNDNESSDVSTDGDADDSTDNSSGESSTVVTDGDDDPTLPDDEEQVAIVEGGADDAPTEGTGTGTGDGAGTGDGTGTGGTTDPGANASDPDDDDATNDPAADGRVDQGFPEATVTDLGSGDEVDLADTLAASGRNVLLWFWSPDSGASVAEADVVQRLANEDLAGLEIVAIGVGGNPESAAEFRAQSGLSGVTVVWDSSAQNAEQYEVATLPSAVLLDTGGDIIGRWTTISPEVFQLVSLIAG